MDTESHGNENSAHVGYGDRASYGIEPGSRPPRQDSPTVEQNNGNATGPSDLTVRNVRTSNILGFCASCMSVAVPVMIFFIPFLDYLPGVSDYLPTSWFFFLFFPVSGIILGIAGLIQARRASAGGGKAQLGASLSLIGIVIGALILAALLYFIALIYQSYP